MIVNTISCINLHAGIYKKLLQTVSFKFLWILRLYWRISPKKSCTLTLFQDIYLCNQTRKSRYLNMMSRTSIQIVKKCKSKRQVPVESWGLWAGGHQSPSTCSPPSSSLGVFQMQWGADFRRVRRGSSLWRMTLGPSGSGIPSVYCLGPQMVCLNQETVDKTRRLWATLITKVDVPTKLWQNTDQNTFSRILQKDIVKGYTVKLEFVQMWSFVSKQKISCIQGKIVPSLVELAYQ